MRKFECGISRKFPINNIKRPFSNYDIGFSKYKNVYKKKNKFVKADAEGKSILLIMCQVNFFEIIFLDMIYDMFNLTDIY